MDLRGYIRARPKGVAAVILGGVAICAYYAYTQTAASSPRGGPATVAFASIDDGKTYFETSAENLPPFPHQGKTAYEAVVFTCNNGKPPFVGYLRRYSEAVKTSIRASHAKIDATGRPGAATWAFSDGVEIKRPGDNAWIRANDISRSRAVMSVRCPDAPNQSATPVIP
jgi:hypothetical protein